MNLTKIAAVGLAIGLVGVAAYLTVIRRPHLQARVRVKTTQSGFPDLWKTCPNLALATSEEAADYTLDAVWGGTPEGWIGFLDREDGVEKIFDRNRDASKLLREVCRTIDQDFPAWLSTEQAKADLKSREAAMAADASHRYELKDYRHGNIVGLALVDRQVGRVWLLTNVKYSDTKREKLIFEEKEVEALWDWPSRSQAFREGIRDETTWELIDRDDKTKSATRPRAVVRALELH